MSIFALQSPAGGFLDEDLKHFNKRFDEWCVQFKSYEDAMSIVQTLKRPESVDVVEITPLSYPQYYFPSLQGTVHATRQIGEKIICIVEPFMGSSFRIAVCDLKTKTVNVTKAHYKNVLSVEGAFANFSE
ncbi:hypothetical protein KKA17_04975 [bacterium]|nr:hypothetical protein [bacterium]MBU1884250.1 hypothetical protein [bacterium]